MQRRSVTAMMTSGAPGCYEKSEHCLQKRRLCSSICFLDASAIAFGMSTRRLAACYRSVPSSTIVLVDGLGRALKCLKCHGGTVSRSLWNEQSYSKQLQRI